jgi:hypothetical protein
VNRKVKNNQFWRKLKIQHHKWKYRKTWYLHSRYYLKRRVKLRIKDRYLRLNWMWQHQSFLWIYLSTKSILTLRVIYHQVRWSTPFVLYQTSNSLIISQPSNTSIILIQIQSSIPIEAYIPIQMSIELLNYFNQLQLKFNACISLK